MTTHSLHSAMSTDLPLVDLRVDADWPLPRELREEPHVAVVAGPTPTRRAGYAVVTGVAFVLAVTVSLWLRVHPLAVDPATGHPPVLVAVGELVAVYVGVPVLAWALVRVGEAVVTAVRGWWA